MNKNYELYNADCFDIFPDLRGRNIDLVLTDPPYGTTQCKWDSVLPLPEMWDGIKGCIKSNAAVALFAAQPFTSVLVSSNLAEFKYNWIWEKGSAKGHFNAKKRPMVAHEDICVFYKQQVIYNPSKTCGHIRKTSVKDKDLNSEVYNDNTKTVSYDSTERYPRSVIKFSSDTQKLSLHPTQKPVALLEYLIKTYTNEGDTVLDFTMGSGSTGVACMNTNRKFIGIERDEKYFEIAKKRIETALHD